MEYVHRLDLGYPHPAELFHENSKLVPQSTLEVPGQTAAFEELREWYLRTAYAVREDDFDFRHEHAPAVEVRSLPNGLAGLLGIFTQPGPDADLLFGLDLCLLIDHRLYRVVPRAERLWLDRMLTCADLSKFIPAVIGLPASSLERAVAMLFLVACPWRYMILFGPRGYRMTLLDAGRLLARLEQTAGGLGLTLTSTSLLTNSP
jgi:hypothetical protein